MSVIAPKNYSNGSTYIATEACTRKASTIITVATIAEGKDKSIEVIGKITGGRSTSSEGALRLSVDGQVNGRWTFVDDVVVTESHCLNAGEEENSEEWNLGEKGGHFALRWGKLSPITRFLCVF